MLRRPTRASSASTTRPSSPAASTPTCCTSARPTERRPPARRHLHQWAILGRSTHAPAQTDAAIKDPDVDYFCAGPVYATSTKPDYEPVGLDLVRYAAKVAPVGRIDAKPWFAIGGISPANLDDVIEAGARRVCVVRAITEASDPQAAADRLQTRLRAAWKADPTMERYIFQALSGAGPGR